MDEYIALVRAALSSYRGKIVVEIVTDTLDFQSWLVQLPATFPVGFNSQDPAAVIKVKWWRPQKADGGYSAKWVLWLNGSRIWESNVQRGSIALTGLVLWAGSNDASKPIRERWLKLTAASARAAADLDAR